MELQERGLGRLEGQGLLFEYTVKVLLLAAFLELVLYRLVSRLGMHFSKLAEEHEWVRYFFKGVSSIGFTLLNVVSLLVFLAIGIILANRVKSSGRGLREWLVSGSVAAVLALTVAFLLFPPAMLGSIAYNLVFVLAVAALVMDFDFGRRPWSQRVMVACFLLGIGGWLYYQTISTAYGLLGLVSVPPLAHEVNRAGEALMVLASILTIWAYGGGPSWTKNRRQRRRVLMFASVGLTVFVGLLFMDYLLGLYDPALAEKVRKSGQGIGWIFQMGMGYTFYLPFALYVMGLLAWSYTVVKLLSMGRAAGYGIGLIFMAGYALQLSHLSLMVLLGLMLLGLDRRRVLFAAGEREEDRAMAAAPVLREQVSSS
jgi:hypothetical protein